MIQVLHGLKELLNDHDVVIRELLLSDFFGKVSISAHLVDIHRNIVDIDFLIADSSFSDIGDVLIENSLDLLLFKLSWINDFSGNILHARTELLDLVTVKLVVIPSPLDEFGVVKNMGHFLDGHPLGESSLQTKFKAADQLHVRSDPAELQVLEPLTEADNLQNESNHVGGLGIDDNFARNNIVGPLALVHEWLERDIGDMLTMFGALMIDPKGRRIKVGKLVTGDPVGLVSFKLFKVDTEETGGLAALWNTFEVHMIL